MFSTIEYSTNGGRADQHRGGLGATFGQDTHIDGPEARDDYLRGMGAGVSSGGDSRVYTSQQVNLGCEVMCGERIVGQDFRG